MEKAKETIKFNSVEAKAKIYQERMKNNNIEIKKRKGKKLIKERRNRKRWTQIEVKKYFKKERI